MATHRKIQVLAAPLWHGTKAESLLRVGVLSDDHLKDSVFAYNKDTMETETLPSMLQVREYHAAVIVGGNLLFVIGGYGPNGITEQYRSIRLE